MNRSMWDESFIEWSEWSPAECGPNDRRSLFDHGGELVLVRHVSWPPDHLLDRMKNGQSWISLAITLLNKAAREMKEWATAKSSHPRLLDRHLPPMYPLDAMRDWLQIVLYHCRSRWALIFSYLVNTGKSQLKLGKWNNLTTYNCFTNELDLQTPASSEVVWIIKIYQSETCQSLLWSWLFDQKPVIFIFLIKISCMLICLNDKAPNKI